MYCLTSQAAGLNTITLEKCHKLRGITQITWSPISLEHDVET